jgi:hypothetical protein
MTANSSLSSISMARGKKNAITVDPILGGDQPIVRISRSEDGGSLCFTDYYGKNIYVKLPDLEPVKSGKESGVTKIKTVPTSNTCSCGCGCVYEHFCGITVLRDPVTGGLCPHH